MGAARRPTRPEACPWLSITPAVLGVCSYTFADCLRYSMEILASQDCPIGSFSTRALSENGLVAGDRQCSLDVDDNFPFLIDDDGLMLLPMPVTHKYGEAWGVNSAGMVVGRMWPEMTGMNDRAFLYDGRTVVNLGTLKSFSSSLALAINDAEPATVVGFVRSPSRAVAWFDGTITQLSLPIGPNSRAADVSDTGHICGWMGSSEASGPSWAFLWKDGAAETLAMPPGAIACEGIAVNKHGHVCGECRYPIEGQLGNIRRGTLWKDGEVIDLGVLPGKFHSDVFDMNDDGTVVGESSNPNGGAVGFVWKDGVMMKLKEMIDTDMTLVAARPRAINNAGQIALTVTDADTIIDYSILLTPIPPIVGDLTCDWIVDGQDLGLLLAAWGKCAVAPQQDRGGRDGRPTDGGRSTEPPPCPADLNGDTTVDGADLGLLLSNWTS